MSTALLRPPSDPALRTRRLIAAILLVFAILALVLGAILTWLNSSRLAEALTSAEATAFDVYTAQSWIVAGAAILGAGIVAVAIALAVLALMPAPSPTPALTEVWEEDVDLDDADDAEDDQDADRSSEPGRP